MNAPASSPEPLRFVDIRYCIYKRLETDAEFRTRLVKETATAALYFSDVDLDGEAWRLFKKQRRILEVVP